MKSCSLLALFFVPCWASYVLAEEDPIRSDLQLELRSCESELDQFKEKLSSWFDQEEERFRRIGRQEGIEQVESARRTVRDENELPREVPVLFHRKLAQIRRKVDRAYDKATSTYLRKGNKELAETIQRTWLGDRRTSLLEIYQIPPTHMWQNHWEIVGDELVTDPKPEKTWGGVYFGRWDWEHYDFRVQFKLLNNKGYFDFRYHVSDLYRSYRCMEINAKVNSSKDFYDVKEDSREGGRNNGLHSLRPGVTLDEWHLVEISVRGRHVRISMNHKLLFEDSDNRFQKGKLGLAFDTADVHIKDLEVRSPSGEWMWRGLTQITEKRR